MRPNLVSYSRNTNTTTIPSGIAAAMFATIGTWAIAKYSLGHRRQIDGYRGGSSEAVLATDALRVWE